VPPLYGGIFAERIPHARLETIDQAGHLLLLERPEQVAAAVTRFAAA
jgi:pimeloyl-ACP methyl ester carboxylesterase